jgi:serine protease AprX
MEDTMSGPERDPWTDRVQCALGAIGTSDGASQSELFEVVAARFASRFGEQARLYDNELTNWQRQVTVAVAVLVNQGIVEQFSRADGTTAQRLTKAGLDGRQDACSRAFAEPERELPKAPDTGDSSRDPLVAGVITRALREKFLDNPNSHPPQSRSSKWPIMIELNLRYRTGPVAAMGRVKALWRLIDGDDEPLLLADEYAVGELTTGQIEGLVSADSVAPEWADRAIYRIWPDFESHPQIDASSITIKAKAAQRAFNSFGEGIVWAVIDSGIDQNHPHFHGYNTLNHDRVKGLHRDFTVDTEDPASALVDTDGHGTHVAGIIAGGLEKWDAPTTSDPAMSVIVTEKRFNVASGESGLPITQPREIKDISSLAGMAPLAKLVSLKVLGAGDLTTRVSRVIRALAYVRETNASSDKLPRIHGVNLSLGYEFAAEWFACGRSPLCLEVDKLVRSGVVVVAAAGNTGYVTLNPKFASDVTKFSAGMTINDPGNAERAITVGSTHRDSPHTFGISYFSSRGPTGDGRPKPDLVAPGERITSAAAGKNRRLVEKAHPQGIDDKAVYVEDSGTSMAAPHVSGAIAAFLSVQRERIGNPEEVKRIFVTSATSLRREAAFQGGGLVDLMRALKTV